MYRRTLLLLALILTSCATGHRSGIALFGGVRELEKDDYSPVEQQPTAGAALEYKARNGGLGYELGGFYSEEDDTTGGFETKMTTIEGFAGLRWDFGDSAVRLRPYLGAGVAYIQGEVEVTPPGGKIDDGSVGGYAHAGIMFGLTRAIGIGVDVRGLFGTEVDFDTPTNFDLDYLQGTLVLAFSF